MRYLCVILMAGTALADSTLPPSPSAVTQTQRRWLTMRGGLPAASVQGVVSSPREPLDCRWLRRGSRWHELDNLGRVVGETRITKLERSEPWPCKMATFDRPAALTRLRLDAAGPPTLPSRAWGPSAEARAAFLRLLGRKPVSGKPEALFFEAGEMRYAVGTATLPLIARWDGSAWQVEWRGQKPRDATFDQPAAIDIDGDGVPEVVVGWWLDTEYGDTIVRRGPGGWSVVAESFVGNTI